MDDGEPPRMMRAAAELLSELGRLREQTPDGVLAFDGDGTLWSGDVGEDVFHYALSKQLLRSDARAALAAEASRHGLQTDGDANTLAGALFQAYLTGTYPERDVCAMMSWCYAGMSVAEFAELTATALSVRGFQGRLHQELAPFLDFARDHGVPTFIVSASPELIVQTAAEAWNIQASRVIASRPAQAAERILPRLLGQVPYAEAKPAALRARVGERRLLAAFGDNVFDIELLQSAALGIAVRPKPALRARLPGLTGLVLLE